MKVMKIFIFWLTLLTCFSLTLGQEDVVMKAMRDELARSMANLQMENLEKPYFISYSVQETEAAVVSASLGSLLRSNENRLRILHVEVRVGNPALDNTNFFSYPTMTSGMVSMFAGTIQLPLDDDYNELRRQIWLATDGVYKKALEDLAKKRGVLQAKTQIDEIPDFSKEEPTTIKDISPPPKVKLSEGENLVRDLSGLFKKLPDIYSSSVQLEVDAIKTCYVNSEGSSFIRTTPLVSLIAVASTQAADGMPLEDFIAHYGCRMEDLPGKEEVTTQILCLGSDLSKLRQASLIDQYTGPVLFEGQAAAELFNQAFTPKLLATRRPISEIPQFESYAMMLENIFLDKLGARVLPEFLNVTENPLLAEYEKKRLVGGFKVDDEGVPARETKIIENGILKKLLSTRNPVRGITKSSGNCRGGGPMPSHLAVTTEAGLSLKDLKEKLLQIIQQQGKEYGVIIRRVGNPLLKTSRDLMAASFAMPSRDEISVERTIQAYKAFPDGREELIRSAEISGLNLSTFKEILAASQELTVYSAPFSASLISLFYLGDSTTPIVSYVIPSLLFEDITVKKPSGEIPKPPAIKHPFFDK